jgi:F0F1-type ATP synthase membrane subunit c/vacuolar-type H+-ATPase subunit K
MIENYAFPVGIVMLILGIPVGNFLAKITKEELRQGKKWFKLLIVICSISAVVSLFFKNDILFFSFLFIAVVTSRSLKK